MRFFYTFSIRCFGIVALVFSLFHKKSAQWVKGRKNWEQKLKSGLNGAENVIWVHCSSLGEFEQGRPIIESLKERGEKILVTFFSPSGYENLENYEFADFVFYLPLDTPANAKKFLDICKPKSVIFVKYEFWFNFMEIINQRSIPLFLISGIFRSEQYFFSFYGRWFAKQLNSFTQMFVQDKESKNLLSTININKVVVSGDNRFDRVIKIASKPAKIKKIEDFIQTQQVIVAGSTWAQDENLFIKLLDSGELNAKLIIAPHQVDTGHIQELYKKLGDKACLYSELIEGDINSSKQVLIVDTIGLLSSIYQYANLAYIGGGFGLGIHNSLEAAVYGIPLLFGPNYSKFREAVEMVKIGSAQPVNNYKEFAQTVIKLMTDKDYNKVLSDLNINYVKDNAGASELVLQKLAELKAY